MNLFHRRGTEDAEIFWFIDSLMNEFTNEQMN